MNIQKLLIIASCILKCRCEKGKPLIDMRKIVVKKNNLISLTKDHKIKWTTWISLYLIVPY